MLMPPCAGFEACCISHSSEPGRAPHDRSQWWRVLSVFKQAEVSSGWQSDPGCGWITCCLLIIPALLLGIFLFKAFCVFFSFFLLEDFTPVQYKAPKAPKPPKFVPPYNGFGSEEDSLSSCQGLVPKPPQKDFQKFMEKDRLDEL